MYAIIKGYGTIPYFSAQYSHGNKYELGGKIINQIDFSLNEGNIYRNLVIIKKVQKTPKQYPRKSGTASKKPIC